MRGRGVRFVDHVVVNERGGVDDLDEHRRQIGALPDAAPAGGRVQRRRKQYQQRPYAFAARGEDVVDHARKQFVLHLEIPADERIELFQFLRDGAAYRIECNHSSGDVL